MFMNKIRKMSQDLSLAMSTLDKVARESLLYGMKLTRTPGPLKTELKAVNADSTIATDTWRGNAYLLLTLPKVLTDRKRKIPCLEDLIYVRTVLTAEHYEILHKRVQNVPTMTTEEIFNMMTREIRQNSWKGRFLPQFDSMFGTLKDVEQDVMAITLSIINQEFNNFNSHAPEDIKKYVGYCIGKKSATHITAHAPRMKKVIVEDQDELEHVMDMNQGDDDTSQDPIHNFEFKRDIERLLPKPQRDAVFLILGMEDAKLSKHFGNFLERHGKKKDDLSPFQLRNYVSKYLDVDIVQILRENKDLCGYLNRSA